MTPLLRGEQCRDFELLRASGCYIPALYIKSFYEICDHAKRAQKKQFPWMKEEFGYPGDLEVGKRILREIPEWDNDINLYWQFGQAEEWQGLDWQDAEARWPGMVIPEERDSVVRDLSVMRRFLEWKNNLKAFCRRLFDVLERDLKILTQHDLYGPGPDRLAEAFSLEWEIALESLIPNEDLEILEAALLVRATAFVTDDRRILSATAASLSLNHIISFVHPDRLQYALESDFRIRWSPGQTTPRTV